MIGIGVAAPTMRALSLFDRLVFLRSHDLEVVEVHTRAVATDVVQFVSRRNLATLGFPSVAVRQDRTLAVVYAAVSVASDVSAPRFAASEVRVVHQRDEGG